MSASTPTRPSFLTLCTPAGLSVQADRAESSQVQLSSSAQEASGAAAFRVEAEAGAEAQEEGLPRQEACFSPREYEYLHAVVAVVVIVVLFWRQANGGLRSLLFTRLKLSLWETVVLKRCGCIRMKI